VGDSQRTSYNDVFVKEEEMRKKFENWANVIKSDVTTTSSTVMSGAMKDLGEVERLQGVLALLAWQHA
jgi:hypothetical protein